MTDRPLIASDETNVFPRELDRRYPLIARAEGVRLWDTAGNEYLDAISGGAMVTSLGHGVTELVDANGEARLVQLEKLKRYDPNADRGTIGRLLGRLQLHLAIGEAF